MTTPTTPPATLTERYASTDQIEVLTRAVASLKGGQAALDAAAAGRDREIEDDDRKRQADESKKG